MWHFPQISLIVLLFPLGKPGRFQGVNSGVVLFDLKKMRLNKLYNKYSEDEGVEELVKTYNMRLRSDFLSVCQCGVYLFDMVQFRVSGVRIGINVNSYQDPDKHQNDADPQHCFFDKITKIM
jgi:hypothetical protein